MNLTDFIASTKRTLRLDGGMGTQLDEMGLPMGGPANLSHPAAVQEIHRRYIASGADLLITNTLTMNRIYIETGDEGVDVREVNLAGARLAREAAGDGVYVLGDMSATGKMLQPFGPLTEEAAYGAFKEQAQVLAEGGVDGFIIETMFSLQETLILLQTCRDVSDIPVIASMAFNTAKNGGRTIMGDSAGDCANRLAAGGASVVGANCGDVDPFQMAEIVGVMHSPTSLPVIAQPNAGSPRVEAGRTVFDMGPQDFARGIAACIQAGASLVGGCCGTSPAHIQAVADMIEEA